MSDRNETVGAGANDGRGEVPARLVGGERVLLLRELFPSTEIGRLELDVSPPWPAFNPTIAADGEGFKMIVRTANYEHGRNRGRPLDGGDTIRTVNHLVTLDSGLAVRDVAELVDRAPGFRHPTRFEGYEDCRLIEVGGSWFASGTVHHTNPHERADIALLALDGPAIERVTALPSPIPNRDEKNWMPFVAGGELHFVYTCDPTVILRCDQRDGRVQEVSRQPSPFAATALRGGSQGLRTADGVVFVVHELVAVRGRDAYFHRLVALDDDYRVTAISPLFGIATRGIEFCAGVARHGSRLVLSFGVADTTPALAVIDADALLSLLEPAVEWPRTGARRTAERIDSKVAVRGGRVRWGATFPAESLGPPADRRAPPEAAVDAG